jgi:hypothetical protein
MKQQISDSRQTTTSEVLNLGRFTACWADNTLEELQILIAEEAAPELIDRTLAAFERLAKTMLTLAPLLRRTISAAVCVLLIFMSAAAQAGEPFIVTAKEWILSTTTHDDILTLRLYATENDWRAFNLFYKILVKNNRAGVVAKGTIFFIETYYDDGTFLIHVKGVPYALYIAILPTLDPWDQFQRVQPSPTPSPNPASTPI